MIALNNQINFERSNNEVGSSRKLPTVIDMTINIEKQRKKTTLEGITTSQKVPLLEKNIIIINNNKMNISSNLKPVAPPILIVGVRKIKNIINRLLP